MAKKTVVIERSTFGIEVDFQEDGVSVLIGVVTAFEWELRSLRTKAIVKSGTGVPATNPSVVTIDVTDKTVATEGDRLEFHTKYTYTSTKLGAATIGRGDPFTVIFKPSPMTN